MIRSEHPCPLIHDVFEELDRAINLPGRSQRRGEIVRIQERRRRILTITTTIMMIIATITMTVSG
jgi:hypothetical protein